MYICIYNKNILKFKVNFIKLIFFLYTFIKTIEHMFICVKRFIINFSNIFIQQKKNIEHLLNMLNTICIVRKVGR